jgi:glycosyltransferase involved in cell wall biosynthesis
VSEARKDIRSYTRTASQSSERPDVAHRWARDIRQQMATGYIARPHRVGSPMLRILMVISLPAVRTLGAARVQVELADALRAKGHEVEFLAGPDVYSRHPRNQLDALLRSFPRASASHLRRLAAGYDVIDATEGDITLSKHQLGFDGLLVARSAGLRDFYAFWERDAQRRWPNHPKGRPLGRLPRRLKRHQLVKHALVSRGHADGFFVCNPREAERVAADIGVARVCNLPFGLLDEHRIALGHAVGERSANADSRVAIIGTWDSRKGKYDLPLIIEATRTVRPETSFLLLGTHASEDQVLSELGPRVGRGVSVHPSFEPEMLPELLATCSAAAFPSYLEGFGFAVIEKLAAGLPVVAYDVPGPRDILASLDPGLLVEPGNVGAFADRLVRELAGEGVSSRACVDRAADFRWSDIADRTLEAYEGWRRQVR